jgi:hypothetical protein
MTAIRIFAFYMVAVFASSTAHAAATPANPIYVDTKATNGDGSSTNPWMGWDTAISWTPKVTYHFREGWYALTSTPSAWSQDNIIFEGTPSTVLKYTGSATSGAVVSLNGGSVGITSIVFEGFIIDGNGMAGDGLSLNIVTRSRFDNIRIRNVTTNGFNLTFNVLNNFTNPRVSEPSGTTVAMPSTAIRMDAQSGVPANSSSANTFINPIIEHISGATGFKLLGATQQSVVINGTVEGVGTGISLCTDGTSCARNTFSGMDLEANTIADLIVGGTTGSIASDSNHFNNLICASNPSSSNGYGGHNVVLQSKGTNSQFIGGSYAKILEHGKNNTFINILTNWSSIDTYLVNTAFINTVDGSDSSSRTILPSNTSIGQSRQFFTNSFLKTASLIFSATNSQGISEQSVSVSTFMQIGDVATASYADNNLPHQNPPANFVISAYVNPASPQNVIVRWTQLGGTGATPPAGTYKVIVMQ